MFHALASRSALAIQRRRGKCTEACGTRNCLFERLEARTVLSAGVLPVAGDLGVAAGSVAPAFLAYLKIDDLQGSSQDSGHLGWIPVLGFSESVTHPGSPVTGGLFAGRASFSDFEIVKSADS